MRHPAPWLTERPTGIAWGRACLIALLTLTALGVMLRITFVLASGLWHQLDAAEAWTALTGGLRFDLAAAGALTLLTLLGLQLRCLDRRYPSSATGGWLVPAVSILFLCQMSDMLYALESGRHVSHEIAELANSADSLLASALEQAGWFVPLIPLVILTARIRLPVTHTQHAGWRALTAVAVVIVSAVCVRGGLTHLPLQPGEAWGLGRPAVANAGLNGAYAVLYGAIAARRAEAPEIAPLPADERKALLRQLYPEARPTGGEVQRFNIVWILLESWPAELIKSHGYPDPVTPVYDDLITRSLSAEAMMAGGHRTVEGVFASFCSSVNPPGVSVATSQLLALDYQCLPRILAGNGWSTAFVQGGHRNSAKIGVLMQKLGVADVQGSEDMPGPLRYEKNHWGVQDPDLYGHVLSMTDRMREPYFVAVNTTTTHDEILPAGITPAFGMQTLLERKLSTLHFADQALGEFLARYPARERQLDTVFVLMADHTAHVNSSSANHYRIPFAIYAPGRIAPQRKPWVASQRDAAPTLLAMAGLTAEGFAGKSLLQDGAVRFADYAHAGHIGWIEGERLVEFRANDGADLRCHRWRDDWLLRNPYPCVAEDEAMRSRALAFYGHSIERIFAGKTRSFFDF